MSGGKKYLLKNYFLCVSFFLKMFILCISVFFSECIYMH